MGYGPGYGMGPTAAVTTTPTAAQQKEIAAIQSEYRPQLDALQQKIDAKYRELASARANDTTTVARLKALEGEIFKLEGRYRTLLGQAISELGQVAQRQPTGTPLGATWAS